MSYPTIPGHQGADTSLEAAICIAPSAQALRDRCLNLVKRGDCTADEAAAVLGETVLAIRPRFSELFRLREIQPTGKRRKNVSGLSARVWTASVFKLESY